MKKVILTLIAMMFISGVVFAQWEYVQNWPDDEFVAGGGQHGIAVDPDGKIWMQAHNMVPGDSIENADGELVPVRALHVFNPDGTPADFSPVITVTIDGVQDTIGGTDATWAGLTGRGLRRNHDGNILATYRHLVYCIDYKTGEGIFKVDQGAVGIACGVASETGNFFAGPVIPGNPIVEYAADGTLLGNAIDETTGFSRTMEASPCGNMIYWAGYTNHAIWVYTREDEFSEFVLADTTMLAGFDTESCGYHPSGTLWFSAGSYNDLPNRYPDVETDYLPNTHYEWDPATGELTGDHFTWNLLEEWNDVAIGPALQRPRGIDFSPDGNTAYVCVFGGAGFPMAQKFVRSETNVWEYAGVIDGFTLSQNYPNPFNPVTEIRYSVGASGPVTLKVYDILGREVATLVNENKMTGTYTAQFDGSNLASGAYIYRLTAGRSVITKRMVLSK